VFHPQFLRKFIGAEERSSVGNRPRFQFLIELLEIECEVLDATFSKLDVRVANPLRHNRCVRARDLQHLVGHVYADHAPVGTDYLRRDKADLAGAAPEIEHRLAFANIFAGIAATVIPLDHFPRNYLQELGIVLDGATKFRLRGLRTGSVALADCLLCVHDDAVHNCSVR